MLCNSAELVLHRARGRAGRPKHGAGVFRSRRGAPGATFDWAQPTAIVSMQNHYGGGAAFRRAVKLTLRRMVAAGRLESVAGRPGLFRLGGVVRHLTEGDSFGWPGASAADPGPTLGDARVRSGVPLRKFFRTRAHSGRCAGAIWGAIQDLVWTRAPLWVTRGCEIWGAI